MSLRCSFCYLIRYFNEFLKPVVHRIVGNVIHIKGFDMLDGTPILDIKPLTGLKRDIA
ncbi:MAG: TrmO family methyltransferase [Candidatus Edwardsbacteria bacterium]